MDAELKKRAQKIAEFRNLKSRPTETQLREVAEVYKLITGKIIDCKLCEFYGIVSEINTLLKIQPLKINNMAAKGKFKHDAASTLIIRHTKNGTKSITPENINEGDNFAFVAENYPHLVEESKGSKSAKSSEENEEEEVQSLTPKQQLQAEYKELFGEDADDAITANELKSMIAEKQNPENKQ